MSYTNHEIKELNKAAQAYINWYQKGFRLGVVTGNWTSMQESFTLDRFVEAKPDQASVFAELQASTGLHPAQILGRAIESIDVSNNLMLKEAIQASLDVLVKKEEEQIKKLKDSNHLWNNYKDILKDTNLTLTEQLMIISLLETGDINVKTAMEVYGGLREYLGDTAQLEGGDAGRPLMEQSASLIDRYPVVLDILVNSKMNQLFREKSYFKDADEQVDYFADLLETVEGLRDKHNEGSLMRLVYDRVYAFIDDIWHIEVPGAKQRIRNPALKIPNLEALVEVIRPDFRYNQEELEQFIGIKVGNFWYEGKRLFSEVFNGGTITGAELYKKLTVRFPALHQLIGLKKVGDEKRLLIADAMGTGKTAQAVLSVPYIEEREKRGITALVVCPYNMRHEWADRVHVYLEDEASDEKGNGRAYVIDSHDDLERLVKGELKRDPQFVVVNYEKLSRSRWGLEDIKDYVTNHSEALDDSDEDDADAALHNERKKALDEESAELMGRSTHKEIEQDIIDVIGEVPSWVKSKSDAARCSVAISHISDAQTMKNKLKEYGFDMLICDESHYAKNPGALRTKALEELALASEYVVLLTGTPVPRSPDDLGTVITLLEGTWDAKNKRFTPKYTRKQFLDDMALKPMLIHSLLKPRMLRRRLEDAVAGLPRLIKHSMDISFSGYPAQKEAYLEILADNDLTSTQKLYLLRLCSQDPQLVGDYYHGKNGRSAKYDALFRLIDADQAQGRKSVIYTCLADGITRRDKKDPPGLILAEQLDERYNGKVFVVDGTVKDADRRQIRIAFQTENTPYVLLATSKTMNVGIDLSASSRVYHIDLEYCPDDTDQQNARLHRRGQINTVHSTDLAVSDPCINDEGVDGSVDEGIRYLHEKRRILTDLLINGVAGFDEETLRIVFGTSGNGHMKDYLG